MLMIPQLQAEKYMWMRTITFLFVGLSGLIAIAHSTLLYGVRIVYEKREYIPTYVPTHNIIICIRLI